VLLVAALADRSRFDSFVVTGPQTGSEGSLHNELRARGVKTVVLPELVREVSPRRDAASVLALARLLRDRQVDVVHTNSSKAGIVGRIAARRAGVPAVLHTVHGWPFHDHQRAPVAAVWRLLERRTAPLAHRLVLVADSDRGKGLSAGIGRPSQYVTVRSSLELDRYGRSPTHRDSMRAELGLPPDAAVVGAVNRLSPQKDPVSLVEAFAVVAAARPEARLLVVGDGPLRPLVERRAADLGLADRVVLTGLRDDVPRLLPVMDVFLSASLWEGLPRTVVAAMASGVPVVATPTDGVVDVVQDGVTGLLSPTAGLGSAVLRLLDDPALAGRLVGAALVRSEEFDAREMVRRLEALYLEVLGQ
jgi:glycosyltransferase involved in cell wall biosynthesis